MTKKVIITSSIIVTIVALFAIFFGVVFRLRNQSVSVQGSTPISVSKEEIVNTAKLKNGGSIFLIDKNGAINNIEKTYPDIKVIHIKTTSVVSVEIIVRARIATYYCKVGENYYILDEELKVLSTSIDVPTDLIEIKDELNIDSNTTPCDFVGTSSQQKVAKNLYIAMISTIKKTVDEEEIYISRADMPNYINSIKITSGYNLNESYARLIISTTYGVSLDIAKPTDNLLNKINICFSTIKCLSEEQKQSGTIKITYNNNGEMIAGYMN